MKTLKECIITLPITPINIPSIGLLIAPFLMDALGKRLGIKNVLALNVNGAKLYGANVEEHVQGYVESVKNLGIVHNFIWRDDMGENIFWINEFFNRLRKKYIIREKTRIMKCECGLVESLAEAENLSPSRRLYFIRDNKRYCKLCGTEIIEIREHVFLFQFPEKMSWENVYPPFYRKELQNMTQKFSGYKFLISRSRSSALAIWTGEENIFLDIDFVWQMFLPIIRRYGYDPLFLIGGNKNIMACYFVMLMDYLIDSKNISIIIPPYYFASGKTPLKSEEHLFRTLREHYDQKILRLFLATALNWRKKESALDFRLLALISKMAYRIESEETQTGIKNALEVFEGERIKSFLSEVRKKRQRYFCSKDLFGLI